MKKTLLILSAVIALSACTSNGSVSNYAIGDDSAAIKAGRNRAEAQLSRAEIGTTPSSTYQRLRRISVGA